MESPTRPILSPSKVLHPVSSERMNQQTIPASPSLPSDLLSVHHKNTRGVSEVQAKVAFLNSLSRQGSPSAGQAAANHAALQRAIIGREEAESALNSVQEELSEAQSRERRISERLESLLEELHGTKERQAHERSIFEKEIRKARKEAFRAGSTLVKLQEELKHTKSESKAIKEDLAAERDAKDKAKQEAFERAYALAGLTEELEVLKGQLRSMEASNHSSTLEVRAHEIRGEDFGRLSLVEGDLAFLTTPRRPKRVAPDSARSQMSEMEPGDAAEATPPKRLRLSECTTPIEVEQTTTTTTSLSHLDTEALENLKEELDRERRRRAEAEEMVHFMNIECQFERCSCRIAESQGRRYIYDEEYFEKFQKPQLEAEAKAAQEARNEQQRLAEEQARAEERVRAEQQAHAEEQAHLEQQARAEERARFEQKVRAEEQARAAHQAHVEEQAREEQRAREQQTRADQRVLEEQARAEQQAHIEQQLLEDQARAERAREREQQALEEQARAEQQAHLEEQAGLEHQQQLCIHASHTPSVDPPSPVYRQPEASVKLEPTEPPEKMRMPKEPVVTFSPETGTFKTFPSPIRDNVQPRRTDSFTLSELKSSQVDALNGMRTSTASSNRHVDYTTPTAPPVSSRAARGSTAEPVARENNESRTGRRTERSAHGPTLASTKRVPLREATGSQNSAFVSDTPINREEALAKIRERRGRARSKVRSVSAAEPSGRSVGSTSNTGAAATRGPRRIPNLRPDSKSEGELGERRDLSAPVRMFRR
ncbi:hypothetical protein N7476_001639 [Penicillium atrosanguineum]|uniref:Uncharacterized protein n=1 Tax=Penicillium atrosanguineum TaxID=1132637 RepID=A0A9W9QDU1_9EURO|nr:hypothetical protein N7476_001639 [Penicillium atrosanguineum]